MNPMLRSLNQARMSPIKNLMQMVRSSGNPQMMMNQLMSQNPQFRQVMDYINQNGGDPKAAFYKLAQERGVDPDEILKAMRNA